MKVTIIGLGWLGKALAEELVNDNHEVYGSVTNSSNAVELEDSHFEVFTFSTNTKDKIPTKILTSTEVLILTIPYNKSESPSAYGEQLLSVAKKFSNLKRILFTSSTSIYPRTNGVFTESFLFLENEKSSVLYQAEKALEKTYKERLIIARLAGLFGPNRHPALHLQGKHKVKNPYGIVNLVHQKDVTRALSALIEAEKSGIYNVVFPEHPYRKDYYTKLYRNYNLKPIAFEDSPWIERKISTAKLMSELNFKYKHSIADVADILR